MDHQKLSLQVDWELEMRRAGQEAFLKEMAEAVGSESETQHGLYLVKQAVLKMSSALAQWVSEANSGRPGRKATAVHYISDMDPATISFLTAKSLIDSITRRRSLVAVALKVAGAIEDEARFSRFFEEAEEKYKLTADFVKASSSREYRRRVTMLMMNRANVSWDDWPKADRLHLGSRLIELFVQATGLVEINLVPEGKSETYYVEPTKATLEWIKGAIAHHHDILATQYWPTLIPPKPWSAPQGGGYWAPTTPRQRLVKLRSKRAKAYLEDLGRRDLGPVYSSLNAMQETPWRIHSRVYQLMRDAVLNEWDVPGLPADGDLPRPPKPFDIETNEDAKKDWKKKAAQTHEENVVRRSKRIQVHKVLDMARRLEDKGRFFYPHQLDFRGRAYPIPSYLHPQGPDYAKGLLQFADGKPIEDPVAAGWLAIHGANSMGKWDGVSLDKAPLEDRIAWAEREDIKALVLATDVDPMGHRQFWGAADNPWQFLAWVFEWAGFLRHGFGFVSSLPVSLDGTCNGLQHFSAALRDPVGGAEVNLVPAPKPKDIYGTVAAVATELVSSLLQDPTTSNPLRERYGKLTDAEVVSQAERWLSFGINRKITKRAVMTLPYGATQYAVREFVEDALREAVEDRAKVKSVELGLPYVETKKLVNPWQEGDKDGLFKASLFLQPLVWEAIGRTVIAARQVMDWLKKVASAVAAEGQPLTWTTPDGLPILQAYPEFKHRRVKTTLDGTMVQLSLSEDGLEVDKRRQASGIAPNWVHSLDAAAMREYVNIAKENGIDHFAMVHDSYGTLAADVQSMSEALRRAFVRMYQEHDVLEEFLEAVARDIPEETRGELRAMLPPKGTLDISLVEQSDFFFA